VQESDERWSAVRKETKQREAVRQRNRKRKREREVEEEDEALSVRVVRDAASNNQRAVLVGGGEAGHVMNDRRKEVKIIGRVKGQNFCSGDASVSDSERKSCNLVFFLTHREYNTLLQHTHNACYSWPQVKVKGSSPHSRP